MYNISAWQEKVFSNLISDEYIHINEKYSLLKTKAWFHLEQMFKDYLPLTYKGLKSQTETVLYNVYKECIIDSEIQQYVYYPNQLAFAIALFLKDVEFDNDCETWLKDAIYFEGMLNEALYEFELNGYQLPKLPQNGARGIANRFKRTIDINNYTEAPGWFGATYLKHDIVTNYSGLLKSSEQITPKDLTLIFWMDSTDVWYSAFDGFLQLDENGMLDKAQLSLDQTKSLIRKKILIPLSETTTSK